MSVLLQRSEGENFHVFVISKKSSNGDTLLVKQKAACLYSDEKLKKYRKENRLFIIDLTQQQLLVQKGMCAESLKARKIKSIEFKPQEGIETRGSIHINDIHEVSKEEFTTIMESSLKEARNSATRATNLFIDKTDLRAIPTLLEIVRSYIKNNPRFSINTIVSRMLEIWQTAEKDDREEAKIEDEKRQIRCEDLLRRRLLETTVKDQIEDTEVKKAAHHS